jgi:hypothetical protein
VLSVCADYTGLLKLLYDWQTLLAGAAAIVGGLAAYRAGVKQARATHQATETSTKSMLERSRLVERAYISGGGVRATEPFDISAHGTVRFRETGEFEFHINNYGKTPGVLYQLGFGFCDETAIPEVPDYKFQYRHSPIDPGRRGEPIARHRIPPQFSRPVVYGRFYYKTIFGTRHSSGFIYRILPNSGPEPIYPPNNGFIREQDEPDHDADTPQPMARGPEP